MLDTPWLLCDTEEACWAELSPEGSVFEMDDTKRTDELAWTRLVQYNYCGQGPVVLDLATEEGRTGLEQLKVWASDGTRWIIHNSLYDLPKLWKLGVRPGYLFDTMTASQMIWCGDMSKRHSLVEVVKRETGVDPYAQIVLAQATKNADLALSEGRIKQEQYDACIKSAVELGKKILQKSNWGREILTKEQIDYATADAGPEYAQAYHSLKHQLYALGLEDQFALEMQILPIIAQMAVDGMKFNLDKWKSFIKEQATLEATLQQELTLQLDLWNQKYFPEDYLITLRRKNPLPGKPEVWSKFKPAVYSKRTGKLLHEEVPSVLIKEAIPPQTVGDLFKIQPRPALVPLNDVVIPELSALEQGDTHIGGLIRKELGLDPGLEVVKITQPLLLRKLFNAILGTTGDGFDEDQVTSLLETATVSKQLEVAAWLTKYQEDAKLRKLVSTYGESYWKYADKGGYIHARFSTTDADTNRIQASEPNVLNAPRFLQKKLWCVEEGQAFLKADYSAQEARLVFFLGNQMDIYYRLVGGMDLHCMTLSFKKGVPYDDLVIKTNGKKDKVKPELDDERTGAKAASFAPVFGAGAGKMALTLGLAYPQAKKFMDNYWDTYPEVLKMQENQWYKALHLGYVTDLSFGRKRFFFKTQKHFDLMQLEGKSLADACYEFRNPAYNFAAQATGASILRFALLRVTQMIKDHPEWGAVIRLTVHDAMILSCKAEFAEPCGAELRRQMEIAATEVVPGITIPVDLDIYLDKTAPAFFTKEPYGETETSTPDPSLREEHEDSEGEDASAIPGRSDTGEMAEGDSEIIHDSESTESCDATPA